MEYVALLLYVNDSSESSFNCVLGKSIHWLDKGHKIFKDGQNDIVISLHHQLPSKKDKQPVHEDKQYMKKDKLPVKEHKQPMKEVLGIGIFVAVDLHVYLQARFLSMLQ